MNKRGSAIVESVMIFPLVILVIFALVYMMIYFYQQLEDQVDLHIMLRAESGEISNNMFYGDRQEHGFPVYKEAQQIFSYSIVGIEHRGLLQSRSKQINGRKYLIDEVKIVRTSGVLGEEKGD